MKIDKKPNTILQIIKNWWLKSVEFDIELKDDEWFDCVKTGRLLTPEEKDFNKLIETAVTYWILLYIIEEYDEDKETTIKTD